MPLYPVNQLPSLGNTGCKRTSLQAGMNGNLPAKRPGLQQSLNYAVQDYEQVIAERDQARTEIARQARELDERAYHVVELTAYHQQLLLKRDQALERADTGEKNTENQRRLANQWYNAKCNVEAQLLQATADAAERGCQAQALEKKCNDLVKQFQNERPTSNDLRQELGNERSTRDSLSQNFENLQTSNEALRLEIKTGRYAGSILRKKSEELEGTIQRIEGLLKNEKANHVRTKKRLDKEKSTQKSKDTMLKKAEELEQQVSGLKSTLKSLLRD